MNMTLGIFAIFLFTFASYGQVNFYPGRGELSIDSSGNSGSDGSDGSNSYYSNGSYGSDGQSGHDASDIFLELSYPDSSHKSVTVKISSESSILNFEKAFSLAELKKINIVANGGNGGRGGSGGKGGNIRVGTIEDQSELLMLVRSTESSGGSQGTAGNGGIGGSGGRGGSGGSNSCTSGGSSGNSGSDGWSGSNGSSGNNGYSGQSGRHIFLLSGKTLNSYSEKFNLKIQGVEFADENNDGIVEFGESISITKIKLVNTSSMQSPANTEIIGLNNLDNNWNWVSPKPNKKIKSLSKNESIELNFSKSEFVLKAKTMTGFRDIATQIPLGYLKENLTDYFESLPALNIKRLAALSAASANEKIFWSQKRLLNLVLNNQTQLPLGRQSNRPVWLQVNVNSAILDAADLKLFYDKSEVAFDSQKQAFIELNHLMPGMNPLELTLMAGNRPDLFVNARIEFKILKQMGSGSDKEAIDSQFIKLSLAKDLLADSYSFKVPIKEKIQCYLGPRRIKRSLKQISLVKRGNDPNVELGITFSNLVIFSQDLPKFYQGRLELAKYLNDLKNSQIRGQNPVDILNDYYKPATISMFSKNKKEQDSIIEYCVLETK